MVFSTTLQGNKCSVLSYSICYAFCRTLLPSLSSSFHLLLHHFCPFSPTFLPQLQHKSEKTCQPNWAIPCCQLQLQWGKTKGPHQEVLYHLKPLEAIPYETGIDIARNPSQLSKTLEIELCIGFYSTIKTSIYFSSVRQITFY